MPTPINSVISELNVVNDRLQTLFGGGMGGGNVQQYRGRNFGYDIFNQTREVSTGRAPGATAATIAANPVGRVSGVFPRFNEKLPLLFENIHNLRQIGGPTSELDAAGESYIRRQAQIVKQRFTNSREFQFAAMLRGSYTYTISGDDLIHAFSGGSMTVSYQVPSGNRTAVGGSFAANLNPLGSGNIITAAWSSSSTDIPSQIYAINAAGEQLTGYPIKHICCDSTVWNYVTSNSKVQALSGTANVVFDYLTRSDASHDFTAVLRGMPWITWHITDGGLNLNGTFSKLFPSTHAAFLPEPSPEWVTYFEGSEVVSEVAANTQAERFGSYFWAKPTDDPAGYQLHGVHNGIPVLFVPSAIFFGQVA